MGPGVKIEPISSAKKVAMSTLGKKGSDKSGFWGAARGGGVVVFF